LQTASATGGWWPTTGYGPLALHDPSVRACDDDGGPSVEVSAQASPVFFPTRISAPISSYFRWITNAPFLTRFLKKITNVNLLDFTQQLLQGPYTKKSNALAHFQNITWGWSKAVPTRIIFLDEGSTCGHGHPKTEEQHLLQKKFGVTS
jgi:hypothetical protein